jgi:hypothetical protein
MKRMKKAISGLLLLVLTAIPASAETQNGRLKRNAQLENPYTLTRAVETPPYLRCFNKVCEIEYSTTHKRNVDYCQIPPETITLGKGDCKDMAFYLYYLLLENKEKSRVVIGELREGDLVYHAWVEYTYNGETWILDPANKKKAKRGSLKKDEAQYIEKQMDSTNKQIKAYMDDYEAFLKDHKMPK